MKSRTLGTNLLAGMLALGGLSSELSAASPQDANDSESLSLQGQPPIAAEDEDAGEVQAEVGGDERGLGVPAESMQISVDMTNIPYIPKPTNDVQVMNLFSSLAHANGKTWFVIRDPDDGRPYVWEKADNAAGDTAAKKYPIDTQTPTYTAWNDQHHAWSIGVDSAGYLHIMGDMHNYPYGPNPGAPCGADTPAGPNESAITSLPPRYRCQVALYWRSNRPYDAASGFTFRGDSLATAPNAMTITYPRFFHAPDGGLYFTSLGKALRDPTSGRTGQMAVILHRYEVATGSWTAIGGSVKGLVTDTPDAKKTNYYPAFFWDNGGAGGEGSKHPWFQGFMHQLRFDRDGGMHFCGAINLNTSPNGNGNNTRLLYAYSPDRGNSWRKANGELITKNLEELPLRAASGQPKMADLVLDTAPMGGWHIGDFTVVAADSNNMPACRAMRSGPQNDYGHWYRWTGSNWADDISDSKRGGLLYHWDALAPMGLDGTVTYLDTRNAIFRRSDNHSYESKAYDARKAMADLQQFKNVSDKGMWETGALYGMGFFGNPTKETKVLRVSFNPNSDYKVVERYPNQTTTNWVWDKGPYTLTAGQQLTINVTPTLGNSVGVSSEIWTAGYGTKLTTLRDRLPTQLTYTAGYPKVAARLYTGVAGVNVDVSITRPAQVAYFAYPSGQGLTLRGPFKVKAGQPLRHVVSAAAGNVHHVNNEIWNSSRTTKLGEVNSQTSSTLTFTPTNDTEVYVGTYIGVANVNLSTEVHR